MKSLRCYLGLHRWVPHYTWRERECHIYPLGMQCTTHLWYTNDYCRDCHKKLKTPWKDWRHVAGHGCWVLPVLSIIGSMAWFVPVILILMIVGTAFFSMLLFGMLWACAN